FLKEAARLIEYSEVIYLFLTTSINNKILKIRRLSSIFFVPRGQVAPNVARKCIVRKKIKKVCLDVGGMKITGFWECNVYLLIAFLTC
ncbi:MAG: hypothetical protein AAGJ18_27615, partial [Bacteroidota bacterium]